MLSQEKSMNDTADDDHPGKARLFLQKVLAIWLYNEFLTGVTYGIVRNNYITGNSRGSLGCHKDCDTINLATKKTSKKRK